MIEILLSTYNGAKYLPEQIKSVLNQSFTDWHLLIRDDGSTDETLNILNEYAEKYPLKIKRVVDDSGNVGVIRSFEILLKNSTADYIMFCDQDDFWLPDKIELSVEKILQMEKQFGKNIPFLVHTDLKVVDENRNVISDSMWKFVGLQPKKILKSIYNLALCNCVTGCTILMNKKAKEVSIPFVYPVEMHDAWIALCVKKYGEIDFVDTPTIEYRQHEKNLYGAKPEPFSLYKKFLTVKSAIRISKMKYAYYHPFVFKSVLQFLYHKVKYFYIAHYAK